MISSRWIEEAILYDGTPLESLWAYRRFGLRGDSIVAFAGPCDIPPERIVDWEDRLAGARIYSPMMLHFIVEHFELALDKGIWRQRLLAAMTRDLLADRTKGAIRRDGDDLFDGDRKLSISIATLTPVSTKIHFGVNIRAEGAPVPAKGLADYGVDPAAFAQGVLGAYAAECDSVGAARAKVRGIS
jgi:hypothetical protein